MQSWSHTQGIITPVLGKEEMDEGDSTLLKSIFNLLPSDESLERIIRKYSHLLLKFTNSRVQDKF